MQLQKNQDTLTRLLTFIEESSHIKDLDALLDRVLLEARRLTHADAGSIFLVGNNVLNFSYIHNDTLFAAPGNKYLYSNQTLEINNRSMAGYVASTGESIIIDDAHHLPAAVPFAFNPAFDHLSGYHTRSILAVPLKTSRERIVGVLQLINALDANREVIPFTETDKLLLNYFAQNAAVAIERAMMTREIILRMIRMCELRDPNETGPHVNRVGAYAAEIYQQWALTKGLDGDQIKKHKDLLRIAAMLHDLGKVAISDLILKKPAKLDDDEFLVMKYHTIYGARFFENPASDLDQLSAEIALNHHERWDGRGYPGRIPDVFANNLRMGMGKQGEEIPISGRIVALADVFDALVSKRVYKEAMPEDRVLTIIKDESGKHFDPEVVAAFLAIYDVIDAIRQKYQDESGDAHSCRIGS